MASRFGILTDNVRLLVGIGITALDDAKTTTLIEKAEYEAEQLLKTKFGDNEYTQRFSKKDGGNIFKLSNTPVNRIMEAQIGGTSITPKYITFERGSGRAIITNEAEVRDWSDIKEHDNYIKYAYGKLDRTSTQTILTQLGTAGDITLHVGTGAGMHVNDNVMVIGTGTGNTDGFQEIVTITGTDHNKITVDKMQYKHNIGADVIRMEVPNIAIQLAEVIAAIRAAAYMIGSTYTFATSYQLPELSVNKGVPYPHFREVLKDLLDRRDWILQQFRPKLGVA